MLLHFVQLVCVNVASIGEGGLIMQCAKCKKTITQNPLMALGKAWHPECLGCSQCGKTLASEPQFTQFEGKLYHPSCYQAKVALRCDICTQPLAGKYVQDAWGFKYHPEHVNQIPQCFSCGRLAHPKMTGQGYQYADKRVVCGICRKTAVVAQGTAETAFAEAVAWFEKRLPFPEKPHFKLVIADLNRLQSHMKRSGRQTLGVTLKNVTMQGKTEVNRQIQGIVILAGLPRQFFLSVAIHELMHAWLFESRISPLPLKTEEGLCMLMEELFLKEQKGDEAVFYRKQYRQSKDPIYGEGFRQAHEAYQKLGLEKLLRHVARKKKLPGGLFSIF